MLPQLFVLSSKNSKIRMMQECMSNYMEVQNKTPINGLILDLDGVLWRGDEAIGNLSEVFFRINSLGLQIVLATNNSTLTPAQYNEKLKNFGVQLEANQIVTSSMVAANYLQDLYSEGGPVYIIGETGLVDALSEKKFIHQEETALAVVVGMDRRLSYQKLAQACFLIRSGSIFIGTNSDKTFPTPKGLAPGAGSIISALIASTDVNPAIVGKPYSEIFRVALRKLGTKPENTLVIGDRLDTDIVGGQGVGCRTALVLSGVTTQAMAEKWLPQPDFTATDLTELLYLINNA
jgi:4-nitrophenyl phosphatase